jgi:hypothetical protein
MGGAIQFNPNPAGPDQSPSSPNRKKRSLTVGFAGLFWICLGLGIAVAGLIAGVFLIPVMLKVPSRTHLGAMAQVAETAGLLIPSALAACLGHPFVRIGCGLFERRNWCRIVTVVAGAVLMLLGVVALFQGKSILGGICVLWGLWWVAFFTNKSVRSQFRSKIDAPADSSKHDDGSATRAVWITCLILAAGVSYINVTVAEVLAYLAGIVVFVIPAVRFLVKPLKPLVPGVRNWMKSR